MFGAWRYPVKRHAGACLGNGVSTLAVSFGQPDLTPLTLIASRQDIGVRGGTRLARADS